MNKAINEISDRCVECKLCVEECEFLQEICENPKQLLDKLRDGSLAKEKKGRIPYSCNICDLCESVCPSEINMGDICLEFRQQMVKEGSGPLAAHKRFVGKQQDWVLSDAFSLSLPDPDTKQCSQVFFPGCNLAGYSPSLVLKTYEYLRKKMPGTGIILGCCGSPNQELGEETKFKDIISGIEAEMENLGASEMILACSYCNYSFKNYAFRNHTPKFRIKSLYEVMAEQGPPDIMKKSDWTFSLHDPCRARWEEEMQNSVRTLVEKMGYKIEEMKYTRELTRCCGLGGQVHFINFPLIKRAIERRINEAPFDILTYCASCREAFAGEGKPALHLLDLFFNPNWEDARLKEPKTGKARREDQAKTKGLIKEKFGR